MSKVKDLLIEIADMKIRGFSDEYISKYFNIPIEMVKEKAVLDTIKAIQGGEA